MHADGTDVAQSMCISTFSEWSVIPEISAIPVPEDLPFEVAAIVGCAVRTGWGSSVRAACIHAGDVVIVMSAGGIGMNAVQDAQYIGAERVIAVDPVEMKRNLSRRFAYGDMHAGLSIRGVISSADRHR
jgi:S-(hydroxymethyl)glutathione dehydrogenase/alcohol dehydrogenase